MARIVLTSAGTLGDHLPLVRLGRRLQLRGHAVRCAFNPSQRTLAEAAGLNALPCGRPVGPTEVRRRQDSYDFWQDFSDENDLRNSWEQLDFVRCFQELQTACADADVLVAVSHQYVAPMVHEATGIPWIGVELMADECPYPGDPPGLHDPPAAVKETVCAILNRARSAVGLRPLEPAAWPACQRSPRMLLLASSRHFSQPCLDVLPQLRVTGFWFDDSQPTWSPDAELAAFLARDTAPLLLTLSSQPVSDPVGLVAVHAEAAGRLNRRLLVQSGWAGLAQESLDRNAVRVIGPTPHAWLFPRVAAVIHHGGIGTTAEALRQSVPMLVEPYGNDQFFNARRVLALGVGAAMHPHQLTAQGLARILAEKVMTPAVAERTAAIAALLRAEDGLAVACDLIAQELDGLPMPTRPT